MTALTGDGPRPDRRMAKRPSSLAAHSRAESYHIIRERARFQLRKRSFPAGRFEKRQKKKSVGFQDFLPVFRRFSAQIMGEAGFLPPENFSRAPRRPPRRLSVHPAQLVCILILEEGGIL